MVYRIRYLSEIFIVNKLLVCDVMKPLRFSFLENVNS
jgi:hypothetical protein